MSLSFRLRLFLTSAGIVASVLAVVMLTGWTQVVAFEMGRLDSRLCSEARRLALERFPPEELPRLEVDIAAKLHLASLDQLLVHFSSPAHGGRHYASARWDDAIGLDALPWRAWTEDAKDTEPAPPAVGTPRRMESPTSGCALAEFQLHGDAWRVVRAELAGDRGVVAANLVAPQAEIRQALFRALGVEIPIALALTGLGAWVLAAFTMKPVNRLREAMKAVAPHALDRRLPQTNEDHEFQELIRAYNTMLERLERSFQQASRFSADAAHELKTPLTILRGRLEQVRRKNGSEALHADLSELLDEVSRLSDITRKLLLLSQADSGRLELQLTRIDLTMLLHDLVADAPMMVEDRALSSSIDDGLVVSGDAVLLQQLLNNLLSNCVRYSTAGGWIDIRAHATVAHVEIVFSNACRAIEETARVRLFERFFRADVSHNRGADGHGLGLSLAQEIARAHGGTLILMPSPATEVHMKLTLPRA